MEEYDEFGNLIDQEEELDQEIGFISDFNIPENINVDIDFPIIDENPPLPEIVPEKATYLEEFFGNDTFGVDFVSDIYRAAKQGWAS